jgi:hypothetical protein
MESITFYSFNRRLRVRYKPAVFGLDEENRSVMIELPKSIVFEGGRFTTNDPDKIKFIRESGLFATKAIWEITPGDVELLKKSQEFFRQKTTRGPVSTATTGPERTKFSLDGMPIHKLSPGTGASKTSTCPVCGKEFPQDLTGRKLNMHMIFHRRKGK